MYEFEWLHLEEKVERLHQDVTDIECRYQGSYKENMMGEYIWFLIREINLQFKCKSRKPTLFEMIYGILSPILE